MHKIKILGKITTEVYFKYMEPVDSRVQKVNISVNNLWCMKEIRAESRKTVKTQHCKVSRGKYDTNPTLQSCLESLFYAYKNLKYNWVMILMLKISLKLDQKQRKYAQKTLFSAKKGWKTQILKKPTVRGGRARNANRKNGLVCYPTLWEPKKAPDRETWPHYDQALCLASLWIFG